MNENKQIKEMAKDLACLMAWDEDDVPTVNCYETSARLYIEGWRKQSESEWIPNRGGGWLCGKCKKYSTGLKPFCSFCGTKMKNAPDNNVGHK